MAQKMCSKESAYSRGVLEEIKNHYIKEEHAWRHFFAEINNNYIEEEITWIWTLIPLSYKIYDALTILWSYSQYHYLKC